MDKNRDLINFNDINITLAFSKLWKSRNFILKFILITGFLSIIYSLLIKPVYKSYSTFYAHYQISEQSDISSIAGLAGININSNNIQEVPSNLYPKLIGSTPFKEKLLNTQIEYNNNNYSYREYLSNKKENFLTYSIKKIMSFPFLIFQNKNLNIPESNKKYISLSQEDFELHDLLNELIVLEYNDKEGYVKLIVSDEIPKVSAQIAKSSEEILQESIIAYKIKNSKSIYDFTIKQFEIRKKEYYKLQDSLASFKDSNKFIKSDLFLNQLNRLESEVNTLRSVYNELAIRKEKAAIDVNKDTPIFTIIEPVTLPIIRSKPKRKLIVFFSLLIGLILSSSWVLTKENIFQFINEIKKIN